MFLVSHVPNQVLNKERARWTSSDKPCLGRVPKRINGFKDFQEKRKSRGVVEVYDIRETLSETLRFFFFFLLKTNSNFEPKLIHVL